MPTEYTRLQSGHTPVCAAVARHESGYTPSPWTLTGSTWLRTDDTLWLVVPCNDRDCRAELHVRWDRLSGWLDAAILRPIERARTSDPLADLVTTTEVNDD